MVSGLRVLFGSVGIIVCLAAPRAFATEPVSATDQLFLRQLEAEIALAPVEARINFQQNDAKFHDFVVGRLHDEQIAAFARAKGIDQSAEVRAVIGSYIRDTLVQAALKDFLNKEKASLPALEPLARERYLANRQAYLVPETARIAHILIRADVETMTDQEIAERRAKAEALLARIRAGEDFSELAKGNSEDAQTARRGGELPKPATRDSLVPRFADAAWSLRPGQTSEVVRTRYGFHIIRMIEVLPETVKPFDEVKAGLMAQIENELLAPKREAFIDGFRDASLDARAAAMLPALKAALEKNAAGRGDPALTRRESN